MRKVMNKFQEMEVFIRVVEAGGISHAASQLGIATSAVSRRLKELENRLGVQLLKRSTRQITLTEVGQDFYQQSVRIINDVEEVENVLSNKDQAATGRLHFAAPLTFANNHLPKAMELFHQQYPNIYFDMDLDDHELDLIQRNIDLAIRIGVLPDSQLKARKIFDVKVIACATPSFLQQYGEPSSIEELAQLPLIKFSLGKGDPYFYRTKDEPLKAFAPTVSHSCNDGQMICSMALANMGYLIAPTFVVKQHISQGSLVAFMENYTWGNAQYSGYVVYPAARNISVRARLFIDFLVDYFRVNKNLIMFLALTAWLSLSIRISVSVQPIHASVIL
jgi:DNA-binding transcriptional LysR family regulator